MSKNSDITHVADTALWVATYRAQESERPDALFHDPFAAALAGERGKRIAAAMPYPAVMYWVLVMRTLGIDELVQRAVSNGVDTVINLGAGLDTRPYRMQLPPALRWIEVDFPHMIDFKNEKLRSEVPVCRLERIAADLSLETARRKLFQRLDGECKKALIITEGVIPYLSNEEARSLSTDLFATPSFQFWIQDYRQGGLRRWSPRRMREALKNSPFKFDASDWLGFFTEQGWTIGDKVIAAELADRVRRPFPLTFPWSLLVLVLSPKTKEKFRSAVGYVLYQKRELGGRAP